MAKRCPCGLSLTLKAERDRGTCSLCDVLTWDDEAWAKLRRRTCAVLGLKGTERTATRAAFKHARTLSRAIAAQRRGGAP